MDRAGTAGDAEVFAALYPGLRRLAAVSGGAGDDPDDLVQEAITRTLRTLQRQGIALTDLDNPGAYLRRTVVNVAANRRRSLARWRGAMSRIGRPDDASMPDYTSDLADLLRVDPQTRAVLYLVEVEDLSYAEVGALLGLSEEAARARASRARRRLRLELTEEMAGDPADRGEGDEIGDGEEGTGDE